MDQEIQDTDIKISSKRNRHSKLDSLKKKKEQIENKIKLIEAKEKTKQRKEDTRRKILVGSYYLEQAKKQGTTDKLYQAMDGYLTRSLDRPLFGLEPINESKTN